MTITIRGSPVNIDIRAELEPFPWIRATWTESRLLAASPFRYDRQPSFYVILDGDDAGCWGDSGASDPDWQRGGIVKLLAFLRDETIGETLEYLTLKYGEDNADTSYEPTLNLPQLYIPDKPRVTRIDSAILEGYRYRSPYLGSRGISEDVQRLMSVGYDRQRRAVTIPWFNADGSLGNVKYRRTDSKTFWYASKARPIREMIYGIHIAYKQRIRRAAIVEAEVDALTLMSAGVFCIATGGTAFNEAKRDLILRSPIEELTLIRDNDPAGRAWRDRIVTELRGKIELRIANVRRPYKDANEEMCAIGADRLRRRYETARNVRKLANFQLIT